MPFVDRRQHDALEQVSARAAETRARDAEAAELPPQPIPAEQRQPDNLGGGVPRAELVERKRASALERLHAAIDSQQAAYERDRRVMTPDLVLALRTLAEREGLIDPLPPPALDSLREQARRIAADESLAPDDVHLGFESVRWDVLYTPDGKLRERFVRPEVLAHQLDQRNFIVLVLRAERQARAELAQAAEARPESAPVDEPVADASAPVVEDTDAKPKRRG